MLARSLKILKDVIYKKILSYEENYIVYSRHRVGL